MFVNTTRNFLKNTTSLSGSYEFKLMKLFRHIIIIMDETIHLIATSNVFLVILKNCFFLRSKYKVTQLNHEAADVA